MQIISELFYQAISGMAGGDFEVFRIQLILIRIFLSKWTLSRRCHRVKLRFSNLVDTTLFARNVPLLRLEHLCDLYHLLY